MNVMIARLAAVLLTGLLSDSADAGFSIAFGEGMRGANGSAGAYRVAAQLRGEWIEMVREIPLGSAFSLGLGVHLGGPELELQTVASPGIFAGRSVDLNRWLSLDARLEFHDIQPYARLRYRAGRQDRSFDLRIDAGLRVLMLDDVKIDLGGPMAADIPDFDRLLDALERETRAELADYYVEPLIRLEINYRFG